MEQIRERLDHRAIADRYPVLPKDEQQRLLGVVVAGREAAEALASNGHDAKKARALQIIIDAGDEAADTLMLHNCRLVIRNLGRYWNRGVPVDDLFQVGMIGLREAIRRYDPARGALSTIAAYWIRQAMSRHMGDHSRTIRIPVHRHEQVQRLHRTLADMCSENGDEPTLEELSAEFASRGECLDRVSVYDLFLLDAGQVSLDVEVEGSDELLFCDAIEDRDADVGEEIDGDDLRAVLRWAVGLLASERERDIIIRRFGLDGGPGETQQEIGDDYGVTRERIRQLEVQALHHMRHPRVLRQLKDFLPAHAMA